jgi:hypothetical protein
VIVRGAFNEALRPGARKWFLDEYQELPAEYPQVFNIETSQRAWEEDIFSTGLGQAIEKPEGEPIAMDRPRPLGKVRYVHQTFGLGYEITREAVEDDLYGVLSKNGSTNLARSLRETEEITAWSVFNNAFTTQLTYDGEPLISTDHPVIGGGTLSNKADPPVDLSVTALQASLERYMLMRNDRGLRIKTMPTRLLVSVTNFWLAQEILGSEYKPFTANNEINVLRKQGLVPTVSRYLLDMDAWFVLGDKKSTKLNFFWRRKPAYDDDFIKRRQVSQHFIHARWSVGVSDWHNIDGSEGA